MKATPSMIDAIFQAECVLADYRVTALKHLRSVVF